MKNIFCKFLILILGTLCSEANAQTPYPETEFNWRPPANFPETFDINTSTTPYPGYTQPPLLNHIFYNPSLFFAPNHVPFTHDILLYIRVHEHGHAILKTLDESTCDCFSASQIAITDPMSIPEIENFFINNFGNQQIDVLHGSGTAIAQNINSCANRSRITNNIAQKIIANDYAGAFSLVGPFAPAQIQPASIQSAWEMVLNSDGQVISTKVPAVVLKQENRLYSSGYVLCIMADGKHREIEVDFDPDSHVIGLLIL